MKHMPIPAVHAHAPLRVLLLLGNWTGGGAERVAVHLMKALPANWDMHLGLLHPGHAYLEELDPARVHYAARGAERFRFDRPNRELFRPGTLLRGMIHGPRALRHMIAQLRPDVVMSFLKGTSILTWLALAGFGPGRPKWIVREGNNVFRTAEQETPNALVRRASLGLTGAAYRRADAVLTNAADMARDIATGLRLDPGRVQTIPNPVDIARIAAAAKARPNDLPQRPFVLTVGRLEVQKGHDVLLRAFARSVVRNSHDLVILGQGSREGELRALAAGLGIAEQVRFVGFLANPHAWMARCDLFVLPSRWEGFPNAAAEALAAGAPLLLADCDYGPREIIEPGVSGELFAVDDAEALATAMERLVASPGLRRAYATAGRARVRRFAIARIVERYAGLIARTAAADDVWTRTPLTFGRTRVPVRDAIG